MSVFAADMAALEAEGGQLVHRDGYIVRGYTESNGELRDFDGAVVVEIDDDETEGDRETEIPTIAILTEFCTTKLTWRQARALAAAIATVESIARVG